MGWKPAGTEPPDEWGPDVSDWKPENYFSNDFQHVNTCDALNLHQALIRGFLAIRARYPGIDEQLSDDIASDQWDATARRMEAQYRLMVDPYEPKPKRPAPLDVFAEEPEWLLRIIRFTALGAFTIG
jgi:hypothetical protein